MVGTFFLVVISLVVAAPIGVLAGVYLNEYARDNWFTRIVNLAVINLAGVPSIVHALFGVGAFVYVARLGPLDPGGLAHAGRHDAAGDHHQHPRGAGLGADGLPRGLLERGRHPLADDPHDRAAQLDQRHPHRRDPAGVPGGRRDGADHVHRGRLLQGRASGGDLFPYGLGDRCMALSMHLFTLATQVPDVTEAIQYGTAVVLIGLVLLVNAAAIGLRVWLRGAEEVVTT